MLGILLHSRRFIRSRFGEISGHSRHDADTCTPPPYCGVAPLASSRSILHMGVPCGSSVSLTVARRVLSGGGGDGGRSVGDPLLRGRVATRRSGQAAREVTEGVSKEPLRAAAGKASQQPHQRRMRRGGQPRLRRGRRAGGRDHRVPARMLRSGR